MCVNLPNQLTLIRIVLAFVFVYFIAQEGLAYTLVATVFFTLACLTDFADGFLDRKHNTTSDFGKLMDPIADKFLILAAFLSFVRMQIVENWMVLLILGREIIITGLRVFALTKGKVFPAERAGKHKTVSQIVAIFSILGFIIFKEILSRALRWSSTIEIWWRCGIDLLMLVTVALTLISGLSYLWSHRKLIHVEDLD